MSNDVIERLKNFCLNNPELMEKGIIKGINSVDGKVVLEKNGVSKNISIDDLEQGLFDFDNFELKETEELNSLESMVNSNEEETIEELEEPEVIETVTDTITDTNEVPTTLKQMMEYTHDKREDLIDKALQTFAIDEKTGNVNINKAIKIITDNSVNNVVNAVKNKKVLSSDLSDYDIMGNQVNVGADLEEKANVEKMIEDSFNNIMVYVEIAKLKNIIYNVDQIANAKNKYATSVKDKLNVLGLNKDDETLVQTENNNVTSDIKPDNNLKKAGFADILILTVIILVYAVIIINLIMKLR